MAVTVAVFLTGVPTRLATLRQDTCRVVWGAQGATQALLCPRRAGAAVPDLESARVVAVGGRALAAPLPWAQAVPRLQSLLGARWIPPVSITVALAAATGTRSPFTILRRGPPQSLLPPLSRGEAGYLVGLDLGVVFLSILAMALVFWRARRWLGLFAPLALVLYCVVQTPELNYAVSSRFAGVSAGVLETLWCLAMWVFILFPDGRLHRRWTLIVGVTGTLYALALSYLPPPYNPGAWGPAGDLLNLAQDLAVIAVLLARYRSLAGSLQRQQLKWAVFGLVVGYIAYHGFFALPAYLAPLQTPRAALDWQLYGRPVYYLLVLAMPVSVALSILRYGLWEVDAVINVAVVYTALAAGLTLMDALIWWFADLVPEVRGSPALKTIIVTSATSFLLRPTRDRLQKAVRRPAPTQAAAPAAGGTQSRERSGHEQLLAFIADIGPALATGREVDRCLERLLRQAHSLSGASSGVLYLREGDTLRPAATCGGAGSGAERPETVALHDPPTGRPVLDQPVCRAVLRRESVAVDGPGAAAALALDAPHPLGLEAETWLAVPLKTPEGLVVGAIELADAREEPGGPPIPFGPGVRLEVETLAALAAGLAEVRGAEPPAEVADLMSAPFFLEFLTELKVFFEGQRWPEKD